MRCANTVCFTTTDTTRYTKGNTRVSACPLVGLGCVSAMRVRRACRNPSRRSLPFRHGRAALPCLPLHCSRSGTHSFSYRILSHRVSSDHTITCSLLPFICPSTAQFSSASMKWILLILPALLRRYFPTVCPPKKPSMVSSPDRLSRTVRTASSSPSKVDRHTPLSPPLGSSSSSPRDRAWTNGEASFFWLWFWTAWATPTPAAATPATAVAPATPTAIFSPVLRLLNFSVAPVTRFPLLLLFSSGLYSSIPPNSSSPPPPPMPRDLSRTAIIALRSTTMM
mmetsp:Transcript_20341/g.42428  ORF Transcript_20341/g.42428 Transcript_20341/m.42428 type:complete len:281 (-) Transcript_20341:1372-2214(-)